MLLVEKWVNCEIIVGVPLLIKAIVLCIQHILEVLLMDIGILKMESIFLHTNITIIPHSVLYVSLNSITLSILAFQLLLTSMTASHNLCHHLTPYMIIYW